MDNMKKAERILVEDMAVIPIYFYTHPYAVKPNVKGITKNAISYPSLINAEVELKK